MLLRPSLPGAPRPAPSIRPPTPGELAEAYRELIRKAERDGLVSPLDEEPAGLGDRPGVDVSDRTAQAVVKTAYEVEGILYVKSSYAMWQSSQASWVRIGPVPRF